MSKPGLAKFMMRPIVRLFYDYISDATCGWIIASYLIAEILTTGH